MSRGDMRPVRAAVLSDTHGLLRRDVVACLLICLLGAAVIFLNRFGSYGLTW